MSHTNRLSLAEQAGFRLGLRPLVTFVVFAFNQERYIAKAIEGALSQDYSPLEVIISDDCSGDSTYEIIQNAAHNYSGPHKIVINRNPINLGLVRHLSHVFNMASGDIIVISAGDDVSLPDRVSIIQRCFTQFPKAKAVFTNGMTINEKDDAIRPWSNWQKLHVWDSLLQRLIEGGANFLYGFSAAYKKELIVDFPEIDARILQEDVLLSIRALLLGEAVYLPDMTVNYRCHADSCFSRLFRDNAGRARYWENQSALCEQAIKDCFFRWSGRNNRQDRDDRLIRRLYWESHFSDLNRRFCHEKGIGRLICGIRLLQISLLRRISARVRKWIL